MTYDMFYPIEGGVTAPLGFRASGIHCGLRKNKQRRDIAMICADVDCTAAGVYTTNRVFAAPVGVTRAHLKNGRARAVICNSGNANACCADGYEKADAMCAAVADELGISPDDVIVASTGVIGAPLPLEPIKAGIPVLAAQLERSVEGGNNAATAIMTTDTKKKEFAYTFMLDGVEVRLGGICKGSGMISPKMGTMLGFITTDAKINAAALDRILHDVIVDTFNMVSVDGDTSTNDMVVVLASGLAGNSEIAEGSVAYDIMHDALLCICTQMAQSIAADGEGATKLLECCVSGCADDASARILAKSVINSSLVKTAMFGADANCGRVLCALGYAGLDIDTSKIDVSFRSRAGELDVCRDGLVLSFDEDAAKRILSCEHIVIAVDMKSGGASTTAWGCDLSYEYVRINGDYRS